MSIPSPRPQINLDSALTHAFPRRSQMQPHYHHTTSTATPFNGSMLWHIQPRRGDGPGWCEGSMGPLRRVRVPQRAHDPDCPKFIGVDSSVR